MNLLDILAHMDLSAASMIVPALAGSAGAVAYWRQMRATKRKQEEAASSVTRVVWKPQRRR